MCRKIKERPKGIALPNVETAKGILLGLGFEKKNSDCKDLHA